MILSAAFHNWCCLAQAHEHVDRPVVPEVREHGKGHRPLR